MEVVQRKNPGPEIRHNGHLYGRVTHCDFATCKEMIGDKTGEEAIAVRDAFGDWSVYKRLDLPFSRGQKIKIKEEQKQELIERYHSSNGISGVSPNIIDKTMTFLHYDGSNAVVCPDGEDIYVHLYYDRFTPL